jgi:ADP-heptose:LPS heptosyltransferase
MSGGTAVFLQNRDRFGALVVHVPLLHVLRGMSQGRPLVVYSPFPRGELFERIGLAQETRLWTRTRMREPAPANALATGLPALVGELRARRFDRIVSLRPNSIDVTTAITFSGAAELIGYRKHFAQWMLTRSAPRDTGIYRAANYLNLLEVADPGARMAEAIAALAPLASGPAAAPAGAYCFMPCGQEPEKLWGAARYLALAKAIAARDPAACFLLVLGANERDYVERFAHAGLGSRTSALVDAPLPEIARAVLEARVVVANDCGPGHVAQLSPTPTVALFGNWDGGAGTRIAEWFHPRAGALCVTTERVAPIQAIGVEPVMEEIERLLANPRAPGGIARVRDSDYASSSRTTFPNTSVNR